MICWLQVHQRSQWTFFFEKMKSLEIKDLGIVSKFSGLPISLDKNVGYVLDQKVSIDLLLEEYEFDTANGVRAPIAEDSNEDNDQQPEYVSVTTANKNANVKMFQSLLGSLLWIARCTRPDICFAVHKVHDKLTSRLLTIAKWPSEFRDI